MSLGLRPYQRECIEEIVAAYKRGRRRLLVTLPTGTGKTVIFAHLPAALRMKKRMLVLAHRDELIKQAFEKIRAADPTIDVGIEKAEQRASATAKVVVASVATLGRADTVRLASLAPEDFSVIVVDEAHHAVADSYRRVLEHFGAFAPSTKLLVVGFTATPKRGDKTGLDAVFEEITFSRALPEMVSAGYLCPLRGWRVTTTIDLDDVHTRHGDFVESELEAAVNTAGRNRVLVEQYEKLAAKRPMIVFCAGIAHVKSLAGAFIEAGVHAAPIWGAMPRDHRVGALQLFRDGGLQVLTNCNVLTEGFDEPRVEAVMLARPTKSQLLYAQMVGRATRTHPGKVDALVIDVVDSTKRHKLIGIDSLFGLPPGFDLGGTNALAAAERIRMLGERWPWIDLSSIRTEKELRVATERIELFQFAPPSEIADLSVLSWTRAPGGGAGFVLALPDFEAFHVEETMLGTWEVRFVTKDEAKVTTVPSLAHGIRRVERWIESKRGEAVKLLRRKEKWRELPVTDKQKLVLERMQLPIPKGLKRGPAAMMIAFANAVK